MMFVLKLFADVEGWVPVTTDVNVPSEIVRAARQHDTLIIVHYQNDSAPVNANYKNYRKRFTIPALFI